MAKSKNGYWFYFSDGYHCWQMGMSAHERKVLESQHGKLLRKVPA